MKGDRPGQIKRGPLKGKAGGPDPPRPAEISEHAGQVPAAQPNDEIVKALVSANSESEEESHCFEIKRRAPASRSNGPIAQSKGRVSQIVASIESGLASDAAAQLSSAEQMGCENNGVKDQAKIQEASPKLDEYGSNLSNPDFGTRKRPLEAVEGDLGDMPTPKKQFVEVAENLNKVEEASLEWPQSDK
ncbi:unnamed protein product [Linum trigynum]|uniref:Uncharacterized protein n=1 Tax=Linum trigynum TaxID=586398 RepID=A0AAV2EDK5_9ROSI